MNWIEVNGISLRYELTGSGKTTLVLIHEMAARWIAGTRCYRR